MFKPVLSCAFRAVNDFWGWSGVAVGLAAVAAKLSGEQGFPPSRLVLLSGLAFFIRSLFLQWKLTKAEEYAERLRDDPHAPPPF